MKRNKLGEPDTFLGRTKAYFAAPPIFDPKNHSSLQPLLLGLPGCRVTVHFPWTVRAVTN